MNELLAYCNGQFLPQPNAHIALNDAGFIFGATITDFCRTFHHRLFRLSDHLARFRDHCGYAHIALPENDRALADAAEGLIAHNARLLKPNEELALILLATPGPIGYYLGQDAGAGAPTRMMHTFPLPVRRYAGWFREGARLLVPSIRQPPSECVAPCVKHRSRLHWWLADREVQQVQPGAVALLADASGRLTETAAANFLIVLGRTVIAPPPEAVLDGISLRTTAELCAQLGIPFVREPIGLDDCRDAAEAMLTGSAFCLAGVSQLADIRFSWPGPMTELLSTAWAKRVGLDFRAQILSLQ